MPPPLFLLLLLLHVHYQDLIRERETPPISTYKIHTAEAVAEATEAAASKSVFVIHSIYEKLSDSNELPTYQVLPHELPNLAIH